MSKKIGKYTLFFDNFQKGFHPGTPKSPYQFLNFLNNNCQDGTATQLSSEGGIQISSSPFTFTTENPVEHLKYAVFLKEPIKAPCTGELVYEAIISGQQTGLNTLPPYLFAPDGSLSGINNANSDIRPACVAIIAYDPITQFAFDFLLTNEDIYIAYEISPFILEKSFSHAVPVGKRNSIDPLTDYVKLAIAYNYKENLVRWLINDIEVYRINRIGFPLERKYRLDEQGFNQPFHLSRPTQLTFGFTTNSLFDWYNPQNPSQVNNAGLINLNAANSVNPVVTDSLGNNIPSNYLANYPPNTGTNFGQGSILQIKYLTVYIQGDIKRIFPDLYHCKKCLLISRCCQNMISGVNSSSDLFLSKCKGNINYKDKCCKNMSKI